MARYFPQTFFTHGVATVTPDPSAFSEFSANGLGMIARASSGNHNFYLPIATQTEVDQIVPHGVEAYFRGRVNNGATVFRLFVIASDDGRYLVSEAVSITNGTFRQGLTIPGRPLITYGITLCLSVSFRSGGLLVLAAGGLKTEAWLNNGG